MLSKNPTNAEEVRKIVEERVRAIEQLGSAQETATIEWRGGPKSIPVIAMPVHLLYYNPDTHRIRAQRSTSPSLEQDLKASPFSSSAQNYLHQLLMGDPTDPSKIDPAFTALKDDLKDHGQNDPGIITRSGILINGNTRQAALKEIGHEIIRVGVLPPDAGYDDLLSIELSLQLRKDHRRDYSFMNELLAIEERTTSGQLPARIQTDFRIKATTFEQRRWILTFVRDAIDRSRVTGVSAETTALRLIDFESHQGKLEELYRAYIALKKESPEKAEALKEQRLLALLLNKSKTDLRLIEPDFVHRYMKEALPAVQPVSATLKIPGTSITVPGPSADVQALRQLTTGLLQAKAVTLAPKMVAPGEIEKANELLRKTDETVDKALDHAGKQGRVTKRRLAPSDRLIDACEDLDLALSSIAEARSTGNFEPNDLDDALLSLKSRLEKLSAMVSRGSESDAEGISWVRAVGKALHHED